MDIENTLSQAMTQRKWVNFSYEGKAVRKVAPHVLFLDSAQNKLLDAYQQQGYSQTGHLPNWRTFLLEKIEDMHVLNEHFEIAPGYNREAKKYERVVYRV